MCLSPRVSAAAPLETAGPEKREWLVSIPLASSFLALPLLSSPLRPISLRDSGFQRVRLKHDLNCKGWSSQAHRESPGKFESRSLSGDNLSREIGRISLFAFDSSFYLHLLRPSLPPPSLLWHGRLVLLSPPENDHTEQPDKTILGSLPPSFPPSLPLSLSLSRKAHLSDQLRRHSG